MMSFEIGNYLYKRTVMQYGSTDTYVANPTKRTTKIFFTVRWTGDIVLHDSLILKSGYSINFNQSLTSSVLIRDTVSGIFAPPTRMTLSDSSVFVLQENSMVYLQQKSSFVSDSTSKLILENEAEMIIEDTSTYQILDSASLKLAGGSRMLIKSGSYLCIEKGAKIELTDFNSKINIQDGAILGANPKTIDTSKCDCIENIDSIAYTGLGVINDLSQDIYIQNETIDTNIYYGGRNIYIGSQVTTPPYGPVEIKDGSNVIFKAGNSIIIPGKFKVEEGARIKTEHE
jgi:hypothetical protein